MNTLNWFENRNEVDVKGKCRKDLLAVRFSWKIANKSWKLQLNWSENEKSIEKLTCEKNFNEF